MFRLAKTICLLLSFTAVDARTFIDSKDVTHVTEKDKPVIVTFAHRAITLRNYGKRFGVLSVPVHALREFSKDSFPSLRP